MVPSSRTSDSSSSRSKEKEYVAGISWNLSQLKKQVQASRLLSVRENIQKNRKNLEVHTSHIFDLAKEKEEAWEPTESENLLLVRLANPLCLLSAWEPDMEIANSQEEISASSSIVFGSSCGGKSVVRLNKLPFVEKIPPYTTWIFLNRNQRMAEDQSVLGRRQIYYDPYGNETLICSDSEEEIVEPEDEKHGFSEGEDQILWKAIQEYGLNQEVMQILCHSIEALPEEIQERYEMLLEKYQKNDETKGEASSELESKSLLDKTLNAALDSFDNLFCRRCLIFDCRLHGCSQNLITATEKQPYGSDPEENRKPCSTHCYLRRREKEEVTFPAEKVLKKTKKMESASPSESEDSNADDITNLTPSEWLCSDVNRLTIVSSETFGSSKTHHTVSSCAVEGNAPDFPLKSVVNVGKRKILKHENVSLGRSLDSSWKHGCPADKKQKRLSASDFSPQSREMDMLDTNISSLPDTKCQGGAAKCEQFRHESDEYPSRTKDDHGNTIMDTEEVNKTTEVSFLKNLSSSSREQECGWSVIEKDLYLKGIEIFGKNRCFTSIYDYFGCY